MDGGVLALGVVVGDVELDGGRAFAPGIGGDEVVAGFEDVEDVGAEARLAAAPLAEHEREARQRGTVGDEFLACADGERAEGASAEEHEGGERRGLQVRRRDEVAEVAELGDLHREGLGETPPAHEREQHHLEEQQRDAGDEDDPAFEVVQEAFGLGGAVLVDEHAGDGDAKAVHEDRDRDRGDEDHRLLPQGAAEDVGAEEGEARQRKEIAQPAAGLDHLQLVHAEVDDVAFEEDADADEAQECGADLGGPELEDAGEVVRHHRWQRDHEEEIGEPRPDHCRGAQADDGDDEADHGDQEGVLHDRRDRAELSREVHQETDGHHADTDPGRLHRHALQLRGSGPDQVQADERDQVAVLVLRHLPLDVHHLGEAFVVGDRECGHDEQQPDERQPAFLGCQHAEPFPGQRMSRRLAAGRCGALSLSGTVFSTPCGRGTARSACAPGSADPAPATSGAGSRGRTARAVPCPRGSRSRRGSR